MPVVELVAKRYHVYALVMRFDGPTDQLNADGTTNWARQWGKGLYVQRTAMKAAAKLKGIK